MPESHRSYKKKDEADPYIVATAKALNATVVTQENLLGHKNSRMNIPDACQKLDIGCINLLGLLRQLEWTF